MFISPAHSDSLLFPISLCLALFCLESLVPGSELANLNDTLRDNLPPNPDI